MLRWRLISAAIILSVLFALISLDFRQAAAAPSGAWLLPLLLLVSVMATEEVLALFQGQGHSPIGAVVYLGNVFIPLAAAWPIVVRLAGSGDFPASSPSSDVRWPLVALAIAVAGVFVGEIARFKRPGKAVVDAALAIFTLVYVGVSISFWAQLRLLHDNAWGMAALFSMLLIVKVADTGAFACGKCLGRHKMTPILSPGKTWEGAIGGMATACFVSWAFFHFLGPRMLGTGYVEPAPLAALAYGALLALAGMIGDLAESLLKRDMQRKDSSTWLRGLGGVLDIIDAPLLAGPVAWLCWMWGLIGP